MDQAKLGQPRSPLQGFSLSCSAVVGQVPREGNLELFLGVGASR